mmetsp:Transcript_16969/g.43351  ORF Transcript_16969/g.43351 Transcript_16969/m.43351 type:complete len:127 (-) Transcript_16969:284-664(-)
MFRKIVRSTMWWAQSKQLAGSDLRGNMYFYVSQKEGNPKREVEFKNNEIDFEGVPVQWYSWLNYSRDIPPTLEELHADIKRKDELKIKVAELEEKDAKERLKEMAHQGSGEYDSSAGFISGNRPHD